MYPVNDWKELEAGDSLLFGRYPQSAAGDDETPVRWDVTDAEDGVVTLVSRYVLDWRICYHSYDPERGDGVFRRWENTDLRIWLRDDFCMRAFDPVERAALRPVPGVGDGPDDIVSLPDDGGMAYATAYVKGIGERFEEADPCPWWTREEGPGRHGIVDQWYIDGEGERCFRATGNACGVRPMIRLDVRAAHELITGVYKGVLSLEEADPCPGDVVSFGRHPKNGEKLTWTVLDRDENAALLLCRETVAVACYDEQSEFMDGGMEGSEYRPWKDCGLRRYMNGELIDRCFTEMERSRILETHVENGEKECHPKKRLAGEDTVDRLFALSYAEGRRYFKLIGEEQDPDWWLRSPGGADGVLTAETLAEGSYTYGDWLYVVEDSGVRPAMRVRRKG